MGGRRWTRPPRKRVKVRRGHAPSLPSPCPVLSGGQQGHPSGSQAIAATPLPAGVYCCGPAPVKAIKEGDLQLKYDIPFIFAEVNADVVYWIVQRDGSQRKSTHSSVVGKNISTKSVGRDSREDITHNYKYPEGTGTWGQPGGSGQPLGVRGAFH